jgi:hypothetical protein
VAVPAAEAEAINVTLPRHSMDDTPTGPLYNAAAAIRWPALAEAPTAPLPQTLPRRQPRPAAGRSGPAHRLADLGPPLDLLRRVRDGLLDLPTERK